MELWSDLQLLTKVASHPTASDVSSGAGRSQHAAEQRGRRR